MREHDFEPVPGLPERPPEDERILWRGAPDWRTLARRVFWWRGVAVYFGVLALWRFGDALDGGAPAARRANETLGFVPGAGMEGVRSPAVAGATVGEALSYAAGLLPIAIAALAIVALLAYVTAKTTLYTVTDKRVVMRFGVALQLCVNVPFKVTESAGLKTFPNGAGDIVFSLDRDNRFSYLMLWPNARPWRFGRAEPMMRAVPNAAAVAERIAASLAETHGAAAEAGATRRPVETVAGAEDRGPAAGAGAAIA